MLQRRALQISIAIAALVPVVGGLWGVVHGASGDTWADNHHRYLSGILLAIGLAYWSTVPRIEAMGARLRLLTTLVVIGGGARLVGIALGDGATTEVVLALAMELGAAPLICLWQMRVFLWPSRDHLPDEPNPSRIAKPKPHLRPIVP